MTIVQTQRADLYSAIKKLCLCDLAIASQICLVKTLSDRNKLTVDQLTFSLLHLE